MQAQEEKILQSHLRFAEERGSDKTYCPSEVARELYDDNWRDKMIEVRAVADVLVKDKKLNVLQKGIIQTQLPSELKGPIRLQIIQPQKS